MSQAILLDGDDLAKRLHQPLMGEVKGLNSRGFALRLATVLVGNNSESQSYIARKHTDCQALAIESDDIRLPVDVDRKRLSDQIDTLNHDPSITGFLVQLPLPEHLETQSIVEQVTPAKDVDGLHPLNLGRMLSGSTELSPCTPAGILTLLRHYDVPIAGRHVVIIGRGMLAGRPLALLLGLPGIDASVTLLHSETPDLAVWTRQADIVISAVGRPNLITASMIRTGTAIIGVGISFDRQGEMVSDIADDVREVAGWVTPRHGSVGAMTRLMLMRNLLTCAERQHPTK